jgi:dTDP-4-dehydrorhamnose reductase
MGEASVLVFGATSLVGSHFAVSRGPVSAAGRQDPASLGIPVARFVPVDLGDPAAVERVVSEAREPCVVNFAARTDVDGCERERPSPGGDPRAGAAWSINAEAPAAIARAARATGKYFVQISTDFIFDGSAGPYDEGAPRSPFSPRLSWYGWTKSEGERMALAVDPAAAVVRFGSPYRASFRPKLDFARWMLDRARGGTLPPLYTDQTTTPTWVPDVSRTVGEMIDRRSAGVVHTGSPEPVTPYEFAREMFRQRGGVPPDLLTSRLAEAAVPAGRAPRPLHGGLRGGRLLALGLRMTPWQDGIRQLLAGEEGR